MSAGLVARNPGLVIREHNTLQDSNPQPEEVVEFGHNGLVTFVYLAFAYQLL